MATYNNPKGSPDVSFNGPITYTQAELSEVCKSLGAKMRTPAGIDGSKLLWALAGVESSFGADCRPRHERAYCTGSYSRMLLLSTKDFAHAAHCSFGPWQVMWCNTSRLKSPDEAFGTLEACAAITVDFLEREIFQHQQASKVEQVADAYNSGNYRDNLVPTRYIDDVVHFYNHVPML